MELRVKQEAEVLPQSPAANEESSLPLELKILEELTNFVMSGKQTKDGEFNK